MTFVRWSLPLLALFLALPEARAQGLLVPSPYGGYYGPGGVAFSYSRAARYRGLALSLNAYGGVRGYAVGPLGVAPLSFGPVSRVTVVVVPPPQVVVVRRVILLDDIDFDPPPRERRLQPGEPPEVPGPEDMRPPMKEAPLKEAPLKEAPLKEAPKEAMKPPPKAPDLPRLPEPEEDPRSDHDRLVDRGREAFQAFEYGRAAMRFRKATRAEADRPLADFLLAQALLAQGKYHEASDAIHAGMARAPAWPTSTFQPLELYGPHVAEYPAHLATLEATLARHPGDPVLLFLSAYHLWFDGRKDEAGPLFRRARRGAPDPGVIDRFLRALPVGPEL